MSTPTTETDQAKPDATEAPSPHGDGLGGSTVGICTRTGSAGRPFKLVSQSVCWSGDKIDVCSVCGMSPYDRGWDTCHSDPNVRDHRHSPETKP